MREARTIVQKFGVKGMHVYIPSDVRKDSLNPLRVGDEVTVSVDGEKLMVTPVQVAKHETGVSRPDHTESE